MRRRSVHLFCALAPVCLLSGCLSSTGSSDAVLAPGGWGGEHASFQVTATGARLDMDCAHGSVDSVIIVKDGRFDAPGVYVPEHGGPISSDEQPNPKTARYRGVLDHDRLRLTLEVDGVGAVGPFDLTLGQPARLVKCL